MYNVTLHQHFAYRNSSSHDGSHHSACVMLSIWRQLATGGEVFGGIPFSFIYINCLLEIENYSMVIQYFCWSCFVVTTCLK